MASYDNEIPSGVINGTNPTFLLANGPDPASSLLLITNGVVQTSGLDFVLSGNTITFQSGSIPQTGAVLRAWYRVEDESASLGDMGYYRDDAVEIIHGRLGMRSGLETMIIRELKAAQTRFESGASLPWFLVTSVEESVASSPMTLPSGFLRDVPLDPIWVTDSDGLQQPIAPESYQVLQNNPAFIEDARPKFYTLRGLKRHLFPEPDQSYQVETTYYKADQALSSNIKNRWLTYAPEVLISSCGARAAMNVRDQEAAQLFTQDFQIAFANLVRHNVAYEVAGELGVGG